MNTVTTLIIDDRATLCGYVVHLTDAGTADPYAAVPYGLAPGHAVSADQAAGLVEDGAPTVTRHGSAADAEAFLTTAAAGR